MRIPFPKFRATHRLCIQTRALHSTPPSEPFKILFFGRDEFSCRVFDKLYAAKDVWQDILIATHPDEWVGRRRSTLSVSPLKLLGEQLGVAVHTIPSERSALKKWIPPRPFDIEPSPPAPSVSPHHLLVTASFGRILPSSLLSRFASTRRLNVHPSLLPAYRGPAPMQHTILQGEKTTGVCVIEMMSVERGKKNDIDAGEVWGRTEMPVPNNASYDHLRDMLAREGGDLLVSTLRKMLTEPVDSIPQALLPPSDSRSHAPFILPSHSLLDFSSITSDAIVRRHRAIAHHKPLTAFLRTAQEDDARAVQILDPAVYEGENGLPVGAAVYDPRSKAIHVVCAQGSVLSVPRLKTEGKKEVAAKEWWNGIPDVWKMKENGREFVLFKPGTAA